MNVLEHSHRGVFNIVLHHGTVVLTVVHVQGWVLENTSVAVGALFRAFDEVLAH